MSQKKIRCSVPKNRQSRFLFLLLVLFVNFSVFGQISRNVSGKVVDSDQEPIVGVTVHIKGTTKGTITDIDGQFSLDVPGNEESVLVFSFIGMETKEVEIDNRNYFEIELKSSIQELDDVVVIGYGRQKKKSVVGSITQTDSKVLERAGGVNSLGSALTGNLPGVITTTSTGMPGAEDPNIVIRTRSSWNNSEPLVLVDGIERPMSTVDINSVENISVLKDASATAVYGVKGANGVILITTKRGKEGKASIRVKTNQTVKLVSKLPEKYDSYDALMLANLAYERELPLEPQLAWLDYRPIGIIDKYRNPENMDEWDRYPNTDWENELFKDYALSNNSSISVSGGTKAVKYFAAIDYLNEGDLFKTFDNDRGYNSGFGFNRLNVRSNLDFQLTKSTTFAINLFGSNGTRKVPWGSSDSDNVYWQAAYITSPDAMRVKYSDGIWGWFAPSKFDQVNSVHKIATSGVEKRTNTAITSDFILEQDLSGLIDGLSFKSGISIDNRFREVDRGINDLYNNAQTKWIDPDTGDAKYEQPINQGSQLDFAEGVEWSTVGGVANRDNTYRKLYYYGQLYYDRSFGSHNLTAMGLFSRDQWARGSEFAHFREDWVFRTTYNYLEKYFLEVNGAYNGSEKFGSDHRFQFFPSFSAGWTLSEENFIKYNLDFIDILKIRGSWGVVGDDNIGARFLYANEWDYGQNAYLGNPPSATPYTFYRITRLGNPYVSWETVEKKNLGVDYNFFNGLISGSVDLFSDRRTDILLDGNSRAVPTYFGTTPPVANIGIVNSQGWEVELKLSKAFSNRFRVWLNSNMTHATNEIEFADDPVLEPNYLQDAGYAIGQVRSFIDHGFIESWDDLYGSTRRSTNNDSKLAGDYNVVDFNADGTIDTYDQAPYQYTGVPQNTYSSTFGIDWRGFSMSLQFYGVNNVTRQVYFPTFLYQSNVAFVEGEYYTVDEGGEIPLPRKLTTVGNDAHGTRYYYDGSFVRLKNAELSYTINSEWIKRMGINQSRLYVNGSNLWLWTDMPDDRESNFSTGGSRQGAYPTMKRINLGLVLTF